MGAITGIMPPSWSRFRTPVSISAGRPTKPSLGSSGSQTIRFPSMPESPTARPPSRPIACTMRAFTWPRSTISATRTVSASETRWPSSNRVSMPSRPSISLIIGPPPWTTTGRTPTWLMSVTSRAKPAMASSELMAWPPNLMTTVAPA